MKSTLLVRHPETNKLNVNFDPSIWELLCEAKYLWKIDLDIPDGAFNLCLKEEKIKQHQVSRFQIIGTFKMD